MCADGQNMIGLTFRLPRMAKGTERPLLSLRIWLSTRRLGFQSEYAPCQASGRQVSAEFSRGADSAECWLI